MEKFQIFLNNTKIFTNRKTNFQFKKVSKLRLNFFVSLAFFPSNLPPY